MSPEFRILLKSIILPFYRSHAGLLIFIFLIMFGTVESNQLITYHRTLITGMFTSGIFMISVCLIWALYSFKILQFCIQLLRQPEYGFLNNLILIKPFKIFTQVFLINALAFLPVIIYTVFIYQIGLAQEYFLDSLSIFLFQLTLCCLNALLMVSFLRTQHKFSWKLPSLRIPNVAGRIGFYTSYFLSEEKIALLISKAFSLGLLYIVREALEIGDDFRIHGLTWTFVLLSHTFLVPKVRMFEDRYLSWIRSMPFSGTKNYLMYFIFYTGLMLPELLFSITMIDRFPDFILLMLLSGALLMFIHTYLLKPNRDPEKFSTYLFWLFMVSFLAILSKLIIALILVLGIIAYIRLTKRYYEYEPAIG